MLIANPIYDVVFKYLMDDNKIAKLIISKIINEEIIELIPNPRESFAEKNEYKNLTIYQLDYSATIKTDDGTKKVLIEIQKAKFLTDIARFRRYIGTQYSDENNKYIVNGKEKAMPLICIYFINYGLSDIHVPVLKVARQYVDIATNTVFNIKNDFIESLTHDAYIIQIKELPGKRRNELEILLSIFDQDNRYEDYHILVVDEDQFSEEYRPIIRRLQKAIESPNVKNVMNIEDGIYSELKEKDRQLNIQQDEILQQQKLIALKDKEIIEKDRLIKELLGKLNKE